MMGWHQLDRLRFVFSASDSLYDFGAIQISMYVSMYVHANHLHLALER